jgi:hypothetical protein
LAAWGEEAQDAPANAPALEAQATPPPKAAEPPLFSFTPYGFIHAAYYRSTRGFSAKDYPGQATTDNGADILSARASRVGVKLALGPEVWGAKVTGVLEADFKGGNTPSSFTTTTTTTTTCTPNAGGTGTTCTSKSTSTTTGAAASTAWTTPLFRIRHANMKATWATGAGDIALVAGQDWTLLAPLSPTTLAYAADQLFTNAGNLNRRAPQIKVVYQSRGDLGGNAALAAISSTDATTPVDYGSGNRARRPDLEGRLAGFYKSGGNTLAEVGFSGHQNTRRYALTAKSVDIAEWAEAVDAIVNLPYVTLQGEGFWGRAIDDTYSGIAPSVNSVRNDVGVASRGLWAQVVLRPAALLDLVFGYGVETPRIQNLVGVAARTKNTMYGGGVIVNAHKAWKLGIEAYDTVSLTKDAKNVSARLESVQLALSTRLDF